MHSFQFTRTTLWRELLKWVQLYLEETLWRGGKFPGSSFPRGKLSGGNYPWDNHPGGNCLRTLKHLCGGLSLITARRHLTVLVNFVKYFGKFFCRTPSNIHFSLFFLFVDQWGSQPKINLFGGAMIN